MIMIIMYKDQSVFKNFIVTKEVRACSAVFASEYMKTKFQHAFTNTSHHYHKHQSKHHSKDDDDDTNTYDDDDANGDDHENNAMMIMTL